MKYEIIKQIHNGLTTVIKINNKYYEVATVELAKIQDKK